MSDRHRHTADSLSRPREPICAPPSPRRVTLPPLRSRPVKTAAPRALAPLVSPGAQGRTVEDARMSAEALILCVLGAGLVGLIVLLGHIARWFA